VTIPEQRGSFKRFCALVGNRNVTEFNYRIADSAVAHIFVGVQIARRDEADRLARVFRRAGFAALNLTDDELAKLHLRHMVGGRSPLAQDELLYRFEFPERPGALMRFLSSMSPEWNISLFHYRNQGADYGRILVGLQVPRGEKGGAEAFPVDARLPLLGGERPPGVQAVPRVAVQRAAPNTRTARPRAAGRVPASRRCAVARAAASRTQRSRTVPAGRRPRPTGRLAALRARGSARR